MKDCKVFFVLIFVIAFVFKESVTAQSIVEMAIAKSNDHVYTWYSDNTVTSGSSKELSVHRSSYNFSSPPGKSAKNIVGIGISAGDKVYVWFSDGTVSSGTSWDLNSYRETYNYSLPPGKSPSDIVGMGVSAGDKVYAWYSDGTVSSGSSKDLDIYRTLYSYTE